MNASDWKKIDAIVIECTRSLFEACGVPLRHNPELDRAEPPWSRTLAVIGFGGRQLRGSMVLSAPESSLSRSFPLRDTGGTPDPDDLRDWSGELVNQLVGRVRRQLLLHGVEIEPSTPTALSGFEVRIGTAATNASCIPHRFDDGDAALHVRFEAIASGECSLLPEPSQPAACEGDMMLF